MRVLVAADTWHPHANVQRVAMSAAVAAVETSEAMA